MQRTVWFAVIALCVSGCNASDVVADVPSDACEKNLASLVQPPQAGVRPSERLALVAQMACFYGMSVEIAREACLIVPYTPEYFGGLHSNETYGLKDNTAALLLAAEGYGRALGTSRVLYGPHNADLCLSWSQDLPRSFAALVDATKALRRYGY
jgi:hypothetical protein